MALNSLPFMSLSSPDPHVLSYVSPSCSQQSRTGDDRSQHWLCTLAALNCTRLALQDGAKDLTELISEGRVERIIDSSTAIMGTGNVDMTRILDFPLFSKTLALAESVVARSRNAEGIKQVLLEWCGATLPENLVAVIFSDDAGAIACLRLVVSQTVFYVIFDPHSHASHPDGPAYCLLGTVEGAASYIDTLFSSRSSSSTSTPDFSAYLLSSKPGAEQEDEMELLAETEEMMKAASITEHLSILRERASKLRKSDKEPSSATSPTTKQPGSSSTQGRGEFGWQLSLLLSTADKSGKKKAKEKKTPAEPIGPPPPQDDFGWMAPLLGTSPIISMPSNLQAASSLGTLAMEEEEGPAPDRPMEEDEEDAIAPLSTVSTQRRNLTHSSSTSEFGWQLALRGLSSTVERPSSVASSSFLQPSDREVKRPKPRAKVPDDSVYEASRKLADELEAAWGSADSDDGPKVAGGSMPKRHGAFLGMEIEQRYLDDEWQDDESEEIITKHPPLPKQVPLTPFDLVFCGICNESHGGADCIRIKPCSHGFCKSCATTYMDTKISEGKYPIMCPVCYLDRTTGNKGFFGQTEVEQLDVDPAQRDKLSHLQLIPHSVVLHCLRCKEYMNVERDQYQKLSVLQCPMPTCGHKWCKACLKTIASSQEVHKCKYRNFEKMARRKGWRLCPGCNTLVQKESGCNHMTCGTPGCNAHFCYKCGVLIIDTTNGGDVGAAVTDHYANCKLFEKTRCIIM